MNLTIPELHTCVQLSVENEQYKKKYKKLREKCQAMSKEIDQLKTSLKQMRDNKDSKTPKRSVHVQTTSTATKADLTQKFIYKMTKPTPVIDSQTESTNRLLAVHNSLMKKYQRELKNNTRYIETITSLTFDKQELQQRLGNYQEKITKLEKESSRREQQLAKDGVNSTRYYQANTEMSSKLFNVTKERDKLLDENHKLRAELGGIDQEFFDEIEDLKYAFQQAASLNIEYDRTLKKLCSQFGIPYPLGAKKDC